jgi:hypothetical protein
VKIEPAIEREVFRALGKSEQTRMPRSPRLETLQGRHHESLRDAPVPQVRSNRERPEETDTAPAGREVRADDLAGSLGNEGCTWVRPKARAIKFPITPEALGLGHPQEGPEGQTEDVIGRREVALFHGPHEDLHRGGF